MPFPIPDSRLLATLREDAPYGDATTLALSADDRPGRKVAVEAVDEAVRAIAALCLPRRPLIAAAGDLTEANGAAYAATSVDLLVTSAAPAEPAADLSVTFTIPDQERGS